MSGSRQHRSTCTSPAASEPEIFKGVGDQPRAIGMSAPRLAPSPVPAWLLKVLAFPAAIAVWSGWVGVGQMTGFGEVRPLPGIWSSLHVNTAVTLPIGVEAYAIVAMRAWLTGTTWVSRRTRRFAFWSAIGALVLGMAGQTSYHLLAQSGTTRAPWQVTTLVSCLPVLFLGLGAALAHMLREDAADCQFADQDGGRMDGGPDPLTTPDLDFPGPASGSDWTGLDQAEESMPVPDRTTSTAVPGHHGWSGPQDGPDRAATMKHQFRESPPEGQQQRLAHAQAAAAKLASSGQRISRRNLRAVGVRGSNADLAALARAVGTSQQQ
jgi:hypothetical protein